MESRIPPHILWPGIVIALFVAGAVSTFSMVWVAASDGGAQVVDNYYEKAVDWDRTAARYEASRALAWHVNLGVSPSSDGQTRELLVAITDSLGVPVSGLTGTIRLSRPQFTAPIGEIDLSENPDVPGTYRQSVSGLRAGLLDVEIDAAMDSLSFWTRTRTEVR
jgi:nitrogen fixation protein FixH